jgi:hypothetical protein
MPRIVCNSTQVGTVGQASFTRADHWTEDVLRQQPTERMEASSHKGAQTSFLRFSTFKVHNPLIAAAHLAFAQHLPLTLSPDVIWMVIMQSVSQYVNHNSERFRHVLVPHEGKEVLEVQRDAFQLGKTTETDWKSVTDEFVETLFSKSKSAGMKQALKTSFSTTSVTDRTALNMAMMDTLKSYYSYEVHTKCDIPIIDVQGSKQDWLDMKAALCLLDELDLKSYKTNLSYILDQFISVYDGGEAQLDFWNGIYLENGGRGSGSVTKVSGWLKNLFLYVNDKLLTSEQTPKPNDFPSGVSSTPFKWIYLGSTLDMRFASGLVGIIAGEDGTLSPQLGWAVFEVYEASESNVTKAAPTKAVVHEKPYAMTKESAAVAWYRSLQC